MCSRAPLTYKTAARLGHLPLGPPHPHAAPAYPRRLAPTVNREPARGNPVFYLVLVLATKLVLVGGMAVDGGEGRVSPAPIRPVDLLTCSVSYACFFAAFDLSRRTALRIRGMFSREDTMGRVAQAGTIVAGGVSASLVAEVAGRPFREAQRLARQKQSVRQAIRHDWRPFLRNTQPKLAGSLSRRVAWRLAAVGPWGFGFLVWAWVGGEV